jgi:hypothetical protein
LTVAEQNVSGVDPRQDFALLAGDLDLAMVERAAMQEPFAEHFAVGADRFGARRFQVGQFLTLTVPADLAVAILDMEEIFGHLVETAGFLRDQRPDRSGVPVPIFPAMFLKRNLPRRTAIAYKPRPLAPIV